jgi:hypothetical protein
MPIYNPISNSDLIQEGTTNKYYTDARAAEKADNPTLNTTGDIELAHNTIYRRGELAEIEFPAITPEPTHISIVEFTSGATPTTVTDSSGAKWIGDSIVFAEDAYAFVPLANTRYNISLSYDGVYLIACVLGVSV